jgi:GTP-binding protein
MLISLDFSAFTGRIAIGRLEEVLKEGMPISLLREMVHYKITYKRIIL